MHLDFIDIGCKLITCVQWVVDPSDKLITGVVETEFIWYSNWTLIICSELIIGGIETGGKLTVGIINTNGMVILSPVSMAGDQPWEYMRLNSTEHLEQKNTLSV